MDIVRRNLNALVIHGHIPTRRQNGCLAAATLPAASGHIKFTGHFCNPTVTRTTKDVWRKEQKWGHYPVVEFFAE